MKLLKNFMNHFILGINGMKRSSLIMLIYCTTHLITQTQIVVEQDTDSPDRIKEEAINPINKYVDECFQCASRIASNHKKLEKKFQKYQNMGLF